MSCEINTRYSRNNPKIENIGKRSFDCSQEKFEDLQTAINLIAIFPKKGLFCTQVGCENLK